MSSFITFSFVFTQFFLIFIGQNAFCAPIEACSENEHYEDHFLCEGTCEEPGEYTCDFDSGPGCQCNQGYTRLVENGKKGACIPVGECPQFRNLKKEEDDGTMDHFPRYESESNEKPQYKPPTAQDCTAREVFVANATGCEDVCEGGRRCEMNTFIGCVCVEGFVRRWEKGDDGFHRKGPCITLDQCPPQPVDKNCDENENFMTNAPSCEKVCDHNPKACNLTSERCVCNEGFIKETFSDTCILVNECWINSNENYEYEDEDDKEGDGENYSNEDDLSGTELDLQVSPEIQ